MLKYTDPLYLSSMKLAEYVSIRNKSEEKNFMQFYLITKIAEL